MLFPARHRQGCPHFGILPAYAESHACVQERVCPCMDAIRLVTLRSSRLPEYLGGGQVGERELASAGFALRR